MEMLLTSFTKLLGSVMNTGPERLVVVRKIPFYPGQKDCTTREKTVMMEKLEATNVLERFMKHRTSRTRMLVPLGYIKYAILIQ